MDTQRRSGQGKPWQYMPLLAPLMLFVLIPFLRESAFAAAGDLDSSFDTDGIRVVRSTASNFGQAVAMQGNKIVVAGYTNLGSTTNNVLVVRLNANGSLDTSFDADETRDGDGIRIVPLTGDDRGQAVAVQSDGKIVVAGYTNLGSTMNNVLVVRLNANGSLDPSFDRDGIRIVPLTGDDRGQAVAVQSDGKIVVAGYTNTGSATNNVLVVRLNANGSLDPSFDGDGTRIVPLTGDDRGQAVAMQGNKIVVAGYTNTGSTTNNFLAVRLNGNGSLDTSFDLDGVRTIGLSGDDRGRAVAVQSNGKIIMAGDTTTFGLEDFMVVRLNSDGSSDATFDGNGIRTAGLSKKNIGQGMTLQLDGKILVVGTTDTFDVSDVELMRFLGQ